MRLELPLLKRDWGRRVSGVVAGATLVASTLFADIEKSQQGSREPPTEFAAIVRYEPLTGRLELRTRGAGGGWETTEKIAPRWSGPFELEVKFDPVSETFAWSDERGVFLESASLDLANALRSADQVRIEVLSSDARVSTRFEEGRLASGAGEKLLPDFGRGAKTRDRASLPLRGASEGFRLSGRLAIEGASSEASLPIWLEIGFGSAEASTAHSGGQPEGSGVYTFNNFSAIAVPGSGTSGAASPYPSSINVAGPIGGWLEDVNVWLLGVVHTYPDDLDVQLEAPFGWERSWIVSDACGGDDLSQQTWYFDDGATSPPPDEASCVGPFHLNPVDYSPADSMPGGPGGPMAFEPFNMRLFSVNGSWLLWAADDATDDTGSFDGGWSLELTTGGYQILVPATGSAGAGSPSPYVMTFDPSRYFFGTILDLDVQFELGHSSPGDLDVLLVGPNGTSVVLLSDVCGTSKDPVFEIRLDDEAESFAPNGTVSECVSENLLFFRPTNWDFDDTWPGAPAGPYGATLNGFVGSAGAGDWKLYVVDDAGNDVGFFTAVILDFQMTGIFRDGFESGNPDCWQGFCA